MDSEYSHGMSTLYHGEHNRHSYPSLPNLQFNESTHHGPHTLPPIQSQRPMMNQPGTSFNQMTRSQDASHPPSSMGYPAYGISQAPYSGGVTQYSDNAPFQQPSNHLSYSNNYPPSSQGQLQDLRPMPMGGMSHAPPIQPSLAPSQQYQLSVADQDYQSRTHVVGSQGRRGILPSDEGRPAALNTNGPTTGKAAPIPPKDAEGKYPCPHCTKSYLHAKHLKRHLLRHTGDRPYSCALCNDTFSRSDILKRHFQKCSIRRGNPTGATHLSNSQSHLRRQQARRANSLNAADGNYHASAPQTPTSITFGDGGIGPVSLATTTPGSVARLDTSMHFEDGSGAHDRRSVTGPSVLNRSNAGMLSGHNGPPSQASSGSSTPLNSRISAQLPQTFTPDSTHQRVNSYTPTQPSNPNRYSMPQLPSAQHFDAYNWTQYPTGARDGSGNAQLPSPDHNEDNFENGANPGSLNGWSMPNSYQQYRTSTDHVLPVGHIQ